MNVTTLQKLKSFIARHYACMPPLFHVGCVLGTKANTPRKHKELTAKLGMGYPDGYICYVTDTAPPDFRLDEVYSSVHAERAVAMLQLFYRGFEFVPFKLEIRARYGVDVMNCFAPIVISNELETLYIRRFLDGGATVIRYEDCREVFRAHDVKGTTFDSIFNRWQAPLEHYGYCQIIDGVRYIALFDAAEALGMAIEERFAFAKTSHFTTKEKFLAAKRLEYMLSHKGSE